MMAREKGGMNRRGLRGLQAMAARTKIAIVGLGALFLGSGCAPNRDQWMQQAASKQAQAATQDIGNVEQVKQEAAQGAQALRALALKTVSISTVDPKVRESFVLTASDLADGLQTIGNSQSDDQFTTACLAMCSDYRKKEEPLMGQFLIGLGRTGTEQSKAYWITFGTRLFSIPSRCDQAEEALKAASAQEQTAEANHQTNVNRALIVAGVLFAGATALEGARIQASQRSYPTQTNCSTIGQTTTCRSW